MTAPGGPADRLGRILAGLPGRVAQAQEQARALAAREFQGRSADGTVTATVDGSGTLHTLSITTAAQRLDRGRFSEQVAHAVNAALDTAEAAQQELLDADQPPDHDPTAAVAAFERRIAALEATVEEVERRVRDLTDRP